MDKSILITFATILASSNAQQVPNCHNDTYSNIEDAIAGINFCMYPTAKFNPSCVAESCPDLKKVSLCSLEADGQDNLDDVIKILEIVTECLKSSTICDTAINPIVFPIVNLNVGQLLKGTGLTGICGSTGNDNFAYNVSNTVVSLLDETQQPGDPISLSIEVDQLNYRGKFGCQLGYQLFSDIFGKPQPFKFDNLTFLLGFNIKAYSTWEETEQSVKISDVQATVKLSNFNFGLIDPLLEVVSSVFSNSLQTYMQNGPIAEAFGKFIDVIAVNALEYAKLQCINR